MDIVSSKQTKKNYKKQLTAAGVVAAIAILIGAVFSVESGAGYIADKSTLVFATVTQGKLSVEVRGSGTLVPRDVHLLSAEVDGRVSEILQRSGARVEKGSAIVVLSNPELLKEIDAAQWEIKGKEAQNLAAKVSLESDLLALEEEVLNTRMSYNSTNLRLQAQKTLMAKNSFTISSIDFQTTELEAKQYAERLAVQNKRLERMRENLVAQESSRNAELEKLRNTLSKLDAQREALTVRATTDGILQDMNLELGESLDVGATVAKVAQHDKLMAQLRIQEVQVKDVAVGQLVIIDTRKSKINGQVTRIEPSVNNGFVYVEVEPTESLPPEARPDLSINGVIKVAEIQDTLYVDRPVFAQGNSFTQLYRVTDDGDYAERIDVQLGQASARHVEIIAGINAGQQIIVSDPSAWENNQIIRVN